VSTAVAVVVTGMATLASAQTPGPNNAITDVPGIRVGHFTSPSALTGATVVLAENGGVGVPGSLTQRGGAPGTRETDLLKPENMVNIVNAVLLSGGGAWGLAPAAGVMQCLEQQGIGFPVGGGNVVPIVPSAVLQEPVCGSPGSRPDLAAGLAACQAAAAGPVQQGNVGAGAGAVAGTVKGGIGTASAVLDNGIIVGALVAVNSFGAVHDERGVLHAAPLILASDTAEQEQLRKSYKGKVSRVAAASADAFPGRGTLAVVATNVQLTKAEAIKVAEMADDGLARAIKPVHTPYDGDTVFALGTGRLAMASLGDPAAVQTQIGAAAADVVARAVVNAMLAATSTECHDDYCTRFPNACRRQGN
jgi:L-aminopeptidase/D-esterase-like protein